MLREQLIIPEDREKAQYASELTIWLNFPEKIIPITYSQISKPHKLGESTDLAPLKLLNHTGATSGEGQVTEQLQTRSWNFQAPEILAVP